jgi:ribosome maturation factor RimP
MAKAPIAQSVTNLIEPVLIAEGFELVDVEYKKEGKSWVLRVFIDKEKGITVEDCQKISHLTGDLIEIEETIKTPFNLEVSSPGLDRSLKREKDFVKFKGKRIRLHSIAPIDNRRKFTGILSDFKDETIYMDLEGVPFKILLSQVVKANLVIEI